jgi:hypothetical protein
MAKGQGYGGKQPTEVQQALLELHSGTRTMAEVKKLFAARTWPNPKNLPNATDEQFFASQEQDRDEDPPGAFSEVADAYHQGVITYEQYGEFYDIDKKYSK